MQGLGLTWALAWGQCAVRVPGVACGSPQRTAAASLTSPTSPWGWRWLSGHQEGRCLFPAHFRNDGHFRDVQAPDGPGGRPCPRVPGRAVQVGVGIGAPASVCPQSARSGVAGGGPAALTPGLVGWSAGRGSTEPFQGCSRARPTGNSSSAFTCPEPSESQGTRLSLGPRVLKARSFLLPQESPADFIIIVCGARSRQQALFGGLLISYLVLTQGARTR